VGTLLLLLLGLGLAADLVVVMPAQSQHAPQGEGDSLRI
jgi:hypothetical protein